MNVKQMTQNLLQGTLLGCMLTVSNSWADTTENARKMAATDKPVKSVASQPKMADKAPGLMHKGDNKKASKSTSAADSIVKNAKANAAHHVWIYSVDITMYDDWNHNGHFSRLVVDFDVDTIYDHSQVYAVMTLTDPNGYSTDYFVTDDFNIYGESDNDEYQVDTVLTSNWQPDGYDLSIHIYDSYTHEVVAYVDKYDAPQLGYLPLESLEYEYSSPQYMSVFAANLLLRQDSDGDGYYHEFDIELDADVSYGARDVYAEVYISNDNYHFDHLYTSSAYHIQENSVLDKQIWSFDLLSGYPPGRHYIKVLLIDEYTHETLLEIQPEHQSAFWSIPLEDVSYEVIANNPTPTPPASGGTRTSASRESGGNFGGLGVAVLLTALAMVRRKNNPNKP